MRDSRLGAMLSITGYLKVKSNNGLVFQEVENKKDFFFHYTLLFYYALLCVIYRATSIVYANTN